jgi:hypothetical protein
MMRAAIYDRGQSAGKDLSSDAAEKVQKESRRLGLPTHDDVKQEFEKKAKELGVK